MEKKNDHIIRIALLGPESTGKSTLSEQLAKHYNTVWVKECAREYLSKINRKYTLDDVLKIAETQLWQEQESLSSANKFIFADTELIISKVWCEDVFNTCPKWILQNIKDHKYDLYLLTYPDLRWEKDPLRENPNRRYFFFNWYERELIKINATYSIIRGTDTVRLQNALEQIEKFLTDFQK